MTRTYARRRDPNRFSYVHPEKGVQHVSLTGHQRDMLLGARDKGFVPSGRYGWNSMHVRSLEKKGLVKAGKRFTHEQDFHLTADGRACVEALWTANRERLVGRTA